MTGDVRRIRLLVVDDHAILRIGIRLLVSAHSDLEVVGEASSGGEGLERAEALQPDVVLLDHTMPGMSGLTALGEMRQRVPATRVLMLTMHEDEDHLRQALDAGASGYMLKRADDSELMTAIRAVARGEIYVHSSLTVHLMDRAAGRNARSAAPPGPSRLSARKRAVPNLLAQGYTNREIADQLFLSVKTVDTYRSRLMNDLGLKSRADLVRYAVAHHLVSFD